MRPAGDFLGQADDARQRARRAHQRHVALAAEGVAALQGHGQVQALVEDARERVRRVQAQRRQHRQDLVLEVALQPALLLVVPVVAADEADALGGQRRQHFLVPYLVLLGGQLQRALADAIEHFAGGHAVGAGDGVAECVVVAQHGHAHLEEFIQVGVGDAQEAQALEQRHARVAGLGQHAEIEFQRGQLAVDVQVRSAQVGRVGGRAVVGRGVHGGVLMARVHDSPVAAARLTAPRRRFRPVQATSGASSRTRS